MTRTAVLAATLVLFAGCVDRAVAPVSVVPRTRFLVTVEHGTFGPTLESRLETELLLALMHQPDLEIVSAFVADRSILRQRTCDPADREFATCRARQLKLTGDFVVELQMGVVPGTWALTTSMKLGEGEPSWLPTLPFSQRSGESLEDAVARAARQLGASLGPTGIRPTASISAARPSPGDSTEISRLCADFNDPRASTGQLAWQLAASVRAHLHETDKDALLGSVLTELTEAPKAAGTDCGKLLG